MDALVLDDQLCADTGYSPKKNISCCILLWYATLRTIMNSSYYYEYRENIHLGVWVNPSLGRPCLTQGTDLSECWFVDLAFPPDSEGHPPGFYPLMGVLGLLPEAPLIKRMPTRQKVFLAMPDMCGLRPCDQTHLKNGLVPYLSDGGTENKYLS